MRTIMMLLLALGWLLPLGCDDSDGDGDVDSDVDGDGDSDSDADADADTDADSDADGDADSDADGDADHLAECASGADCPDERDALWTALQELRDLDCPDDPLTRDEGVEGAAQERAVAMATAGEYGPAALLDVESRLENHDVELSGSSDIGENNGRSNSIEGLADIFAEHEGMRGRIANCDFTLVGIGVAADDQGRFWCTQTFVGL